MENKNINIKDTLKHIKDTIDDQHDNKDSSEEYILLDKIIKKKKTVTISTNKKNSLIKPQVTKSKLLNVYNENKKTNKTIKKASINKEENIKSTNKDPVAALVDREIKPIIKKWISKNLKSFVKTIVIQEMKLISKASQKQK